MIILGIDPGSTRAGYGIIEFEQSHPQFIAGGIIKTTSSDKNILLTELYSSVNKLIAEFSPALVGMEKLFFSKNLKTAIEVSQSRGVLVLAVQQHKIPFLEFTPSEIKQGLVGWGKADKKAVTTMVKKALSIPLYTAHDDVFDALAAALMAGYAQRFSRRIAAA